MNERIQELMQKAQVEVRVSIDPHTFRQYPDPNGPHTIIEFSAEKFAELIVRECELNAAAELRRLHEINTELLEIAYLVRSAANNRADKDFKLMHLDLSEAAEKASKATGEQAMNRFGVER